MDQVLPFPPIGSVTLIPNGSTGSEDKLLASVECVGQRVRPNTLQVLHVKRV